MCVYVLMWFMCVCARMCYVLRVLCVCLCGLCMCVYVLKCVVCVCVHMHVKARVQSFELFFGMLLIFWCSLVRLRWLISEL